MISAQYFYDDHGSRLFEDITQQPEYYQTRAERAILQRVADEIIKTAHTEELVELGSGSSSKTRVLLDAMQRAKQLRCYVPFDVSEGIIRRVSEELAAEYPDLRIHGIIGDFIKHLENIPREGRRLILFLGGTIGNFTPREAVRFLRAVHNILEPGEHLLLGTDLIKNKARLEAAYNDANGVTAAFNVNILNVLNKETGANFDPEGFEHKAIYNEEKCRIEMWLHATRSQEVHLRKLALTLFFKTGDRILTEVSLKYDRARIDNVLHQSGLELVEMYTDDESLFALNLVRRPEAPSR